ncbi:MAG: hypothetical protein AAF518_05460 [Spirochaetota bacterium]
MRQFFLLFLLLGISLFAREISNGTNGFVGFTFSGAEIQKAEPSGYRIVLKKNESLPSELFLDFENRQAKHLRDKNGKYKVLAANYSVLESQTKLGKRYASFSAKNSMISIKVAKKQLLSSVAITEKFYLSFFLIPGDLEKNSTIVSKSYITRGKRYGLKVNLVNNRIQVDFHNMFRMGKGVSRSLRLRSPDALIFDKWTHVAIVIDPPRGQVSLFENGVRKDKAYGYLEGVGSTILPFGFHRNDTSPLFIGKHFYGKMDNFFVGKGEPNFGFLETPYRKVEYDPTVKTAEQFYGTAYSPVYKTRYSKSLPHRLFYDVETPQGAYSEVLYRFSETPFYPDSTHIPWRNAQEFSVIGKRRNIVHGKPDIDFPRFQYFQWKVLLRSDYRGRNTPIVKNLSLKYSYSLPPDAPTGLRLNEEKRTEVYSGERPGVCLNWNSNHEKSVNQNGGGYIIQYGVSPEQMVASLYIDKSGARITGLVRANELGRYYKKLGICVDNELIAKNAYLQKDKSLLTLKKGITYYFKVSAYNEFFSYQKIDRYTDQIGKPSRAVSITLPNYSFARD